MTTSSVSDNRAGDFTFQSVLIESDRLNKSVEIKRTVTDLDIYEHLDKPYLTATLTFADTTNIYTQIDILGAEKVTIKLQSTREDTFPISKVFFVAKIIMAQKGNENADVIILQLIEDVAFYSNLQNLNRSYTGNALDINTKIAKNYLNRNVISGNMKPKQSMKLIIPNMSPLESMVWIKNRAKTIDGMPYYLFSPLVSNSLIMTDLGSMLLEPVINPYPYRLSQALASRNLNPDVKRRIIYDYNQKDMEDLYSLIAKGLIGSRYEFLDVLSNQRRDFHFDISKDLLKPLIDKGYLQKNQPNASYSSDYKFNEKSFNDYDSRRITVIGGIDPYRDVDEGEYPLAFGESKTLADYKLNVISDAVDQLLKKTPMTIDIPGIDFIDGDKHSTIGNQIRLEFPINLPGAGKDQPQIDTKKSGDYLIFAARHKFKLEKYDLTLSCLKLANYRAPA